MGLPSDLASVCLVAKGFPPDICPAEVVRQVSKTTGLSVEAIAQTYPEEGDGVRASEGGWLLRLPGHGDQKTCLLKHRTLSITIGGASFTVKLDFPSLNLSTKTLQWIVMNEERLDSVATEDLYGDGGGRSEAGRGWQGSHQDLPQLQRGQQYYPHMAPPMGLGFPDYVGYGHHGPVPTPPLSSNSHRSSPTLSTLGVDPRSDASSESASPSSKGFQVPPHQRQQWPGVEPSMGMVPGSFPYGLQNEMHRRYSAGMGPPGDNLHYPSPHVPFSEGGPGPGQHGMGGLRFDPPQPYQGGYHQQPGNFPPFVGHQEAEYQSGEGSRTQECDVYLKVTELPEAISERELEAFFQNRRESGGGPIASISFSAATKSAAIFFQDGDDVERVLQRAPLLLKGKKIRVESASRQQQEAEVKTVEIRGLQSEDDVELCIYYFDNPEKGGGEINSKHWNEDEKILLITFEEAEVAKAVAAKGHAPGGKVLEVSLYKPPTEEEDPPQCTVLVRGFDASKRDLYEMYFSNPRRGGDTIAELRISEDEKAMYITFHSPEVAERIAQSVHTVGGRQLEVCLAPVARTSPPATIIITDCDLTNAELYRFYFENPKRGGGEISDFVPDEKQNAILITFTDPQVAQRLAMQEHTIRKTVLKVALYTPEKREPLQPQSTQEAKESAEEEAEEEVAPKTVVVKVGEQRVESEDTYQLYFESHRHGGGEVEEVEVDEEKKMVYITFKEAEVAARVAQKQHVYNRQRMDVSLYVPPKPKPTYPNKLLFKNVADSTTRDCLCMYLERMTGLEPLEVVYGDEVGTVLVTFDQEPDLAQTLKNCQKRVLEGRKLAVSKVPISNCLLVEGLNRQTTQDTIEYYFENKRSGGGPVERIDLRKKENKCFVYFEDHTVLDRILKKSHELDKRPLVVKRYVECLGQSGGSEDPTAFIMPQPVTMDTIDCYKVAYLRQSKTAHSTFLQQLKQSHAKGKFSGDSLVLECILTPAVDKARILARTWAVDIQQTVDSFLSVLQVCRREVMQQLWQEVEKAVSAAGIRSPEGAVLFTLTQESAFVVVGMKSLAQELFDKVVTTIKTAEDQIERRNQEVTETNNKLKNYQLRLLLAMGFHMEAQKRYQDLKVVINVKANSIVFHGQVRDVKVAQVEMYEALQPLKSDKMAKLSAQQKKLLENKDVKPHIVQKFKKESVIAVWEVDAQSQVTVFAFSDKNLVEAIHIINKSLPEHTCELSSESVDVLHTSAWAQLVERLTNANPNILLFTADNTSMRITCIDSIMHGVVEEVETFLQENSIYSQVVRFSPSRQVFVQQEWSQRLIGLQHSLNAHKVQITMKEAGTELYLKGTNQGLTELRKRLEELNAQIYCHEEKLVDKAKIKCLSSPHADRDLKVLSQTHHCVVALTPEAADLQVEAAGDAGKKVISLQKIENAQTLTSIQLPSGVTITAIQGDLTQLPVDVIVNAANNRMDHIGGLARDIVEKGGKVIQEESHRLLKQKRGPLKEGDALMTGAGQLQCKAVVHAVGPVYRNGLSGEEDCLHDTILRCLSMAEEAGHASIAIPAISTGIFRYPPKEATRAIVEAIKKYMESHRRSRIHSIYLCHFTADVGHMFAEAIQRTFPSARSTSAHSKPVPAPRPGVKGVGSPSGATTGQKVISVAIVPGEIGKQRADVIVNSTSNGLDLQSGAISGSILRIAGSGLQDECRQKYPKGINTGDIAQTSGHGLACKQVYHLALCNWHNPSAQQMLGCSVMKCLMEANRQQHQTIAFPVLGTGNLGYPADTVAQTMLGAIDDFGKNTPSTSLTNASIVIYHADQKNLQIFQDLQKKLGAGASVTFTQPSPSAKPSGNRQNRRFSGSGNKQVKLPPQLTDAAGTSAVFEIEQVKLIIKQGDITEECADAIVNSSNSKLDLSKGNVASALKAKCGDQLVKECARKVVEIQQKGITHTKAYNMKSRMILHINSEKFHSDWTEAIRLCLKEAEMLGVSTLAMPALGTGAFGQTPSQSASVLFHTLVKVISERGINSLQELRVVLYDLKMIPQFVSAVEELGKKHSQNQGFFQWIKSAVTGATAPSVKQTYMDEKLNDITLYIYTASKDEIPRILCAFDDLVKDRFVQKVVRDDILLTLGNAEIEEIYMLKRKHKVEISVEQTRGQVVVDGLQNDVFEAMQKISQILRQVERGRQELHAASMLANMVQWSYIEVTKKGTKAVEYDQKENHVIEMAFQSKKKSVELTDVDGCVYVVDFDSMTEYPETNPADAANVMRQDKMKDQASGAMPSNWVDHTGDEHVKMVALNTTDQEYKNVETNLRATLGNRTINITAIARVQNRTLYQQYAAKKAHLEKQNTGIQNEKTLWHGTGPEAIENINNYGFNRSYCGKNATVYGQGVYFAVNSHYSTHPTYSPADPSSKRHIYQCKVLVGHSVVGKRDLRVLPPREGAILYDSATDNPNNSAMYIIFNDTQAYPEYLITFTGQ